MQPSMSREGVPITVIASKPMVLYNLTTLKALQSQHPSLSQWSPIMGALMQP